MASLVSKEELSDKLVGKEVKVHVVHVDNPYSIYIRRVQDVHNFQVLQDLIDDTAAAAAKCQAKAVSVNEMVLIRPTKESRWSRAVKVKQNKLHRIDYGDTWTGSSTDDGCQMVKAPLSISQHPPYALHVRLAFVVPVYHYWTSTCINVLKELLAHYRMFGMKILSMDNDGLLWVDLLSHFPEDVWVNLRQSMSQALVCFNVATFKSEQDRVNEEKRWAKSYVAAQNHHYMPVNLSVGNVFDAKFVKVCDQQQPPEMWTTFGFELALIGSRESVASDRTDNLFFIGLNMGQQLQAHYAGSFNGGTEYIFSCPFVGLRCATIQPSHPDRLPRRVVVTHVNSWSKIKVQDVDTGLELLVSTRCLRLLPLKYASVPRRLTTVYLHNVASTPSQAQLQICKSDNLLVYINGCSSNNNHWPVVTLYVKNRTNLTNLNGLYDGQGLGLPKLRFPPLMNQVTYHYKIPSTLPPINQHKVTTEAYEATVVRTESPDLVMVRPIEQDAYLACLLEKLSRYCAKRPRDKWKGYVFDMCAVPMNNTSIFMRGRVMSIQKNGNVLVAMLDFGNLEMASHVSLLKPLPSKFSDQPLAYRSIKLDNIQVPSDSTDWTPLGLSFTRSVLPMGSRVCVYLEGTTAELFSLDQDQDDTDSFWPNVVKHLVELGVGEMVGEQDESWCVPIMTSDLDFLWHGLATFQWKDAELHESRFKATVQHVFRGDGCIHLLPVKDAPALRLINAEMAELYSESAPMPHDMFWYSGQVCAVQSPLFMDWCRGQVEVVYEKDKKCLVFLVDYGCLEEIQFVNMRKNLSANVCRRPRLCHHWPLKSMNSLAHLHNVEFVAELLQGNVVTAELMDSRENKIFLGRVDLDDIIKEVVAGM